MPGSGSVRDDGDVSMDSAPPPAETVSRWWLFLMGVLTGLAGIATSQAATALLGQETSPLVAVAEVVRDRTPGSIAEPLIRLVQHLDKPLLVTGTTLGLLLLAGYAGVQSVRRRWLSYLVLTVMGLLALLAVMTRPNAGPAAFIPLAVGVGTWLAVLGWLTAPTVESGERRSFLVRGGLAAVATLAVAGFGEWVGRGRTRVEQARKLLRLSATPGTVPAGANLGVSTFQPWRTPNARFYQIHTAISLPTITPDEWQLRIHGMVDKPLTLTYDDLVRRQLTEEWVTLCCVSNPVGGDLVGNAFWSGVLVRDLLAEAGVKPGADAVKQTSQDGWTCGTPLSALTDPNRQAMLAVAMNGKPLPIEHGFPVRMVVPGLYGYVSATKWLVDLEVTDFTRFSAYWTDRGWSEQGPVKTESRIDVPAQGQQLRLGRQRFGGSAWAQHTGISKVEFQLDGGEWQDATLGKVPNDDTWVQWSGAADLAKGDHVLMVRATDRSGYTQTPAKADVVPNGATGWHTVRFTAGSG
jgi:DMSO/TMAO reductase YedYZ molybdopterin-dependent catalytic subunit